MLRRIHLVRQYDSMQCGAACLCMIAKYYRMDFTLAEMDNLCDSTTRGVSMWAISQTARHIGLEPYARRMSIDYLSKVDYPIILFWNQNHFVVFYGKTISGKYRIADPGKGKYTVDRQTMIKSWASDCSKSKPMGIGIITLPGKENVSCNNRRHNDTILGYVLSFFKKYKAHIALICVALLLVTSLQLIIPFFTKLIVDKGINGRDIRFIWLILLGEMMVICGRTTADFVRRWLLLHISVRIDIELLLAFFKKLTRLGMSFFDTKLLGDLMQRTSDHYRVQSFLTSETITIVFTIFNFAALGAALFLLDNIVCSLFLLSTLLYALWIAAFLKRRKLLDFEYFENNCQNNNITYEFLSSLSEIKLQGCEKIKCQQWVDTQKNLFRTRLKSLKLTQTQESGNVLINEIKNVVITVMSATAVIEGRISLGDMLAIQYIIGQMNSPVSQIMSFIYSLQDVKISLGRINEIHNRNDEDCNRNAMLKLPLKTGIKISHLSFRYEKNSNRINLSDITLNIPVGKTTAIVGLSGSGKTTLLKLLLGFYDSYEGDIEIDGISLKELNLYKFRENCGVVMQDGIIFSDTIARNIASDNNDINSDKLEKAAEAACILDFIKSQPLRFETVIGRNGKNISQGQKQRILIARALYKNPHILFFDEATNSLDSINENKISNCLEEFFKGKTVVIVAHRLSTIKNADQIVVLENGKIVETGTHTSLLQKCGRYFSLVSKQIETLEEYA